MIIIGDERICMYSYSVPALLWEDCWEWDLSVFWRLIRKDKIRSGDKRRCCYKNRPEKQNDEKTRKYKFQAEDGEGWSVVLR